MTGIGSIDAIVQLWWLAWAAFSFPHIHSMFLSEWQNFPAGQNFGVNGSVLAIGVLFTPITKWFGPVVTWNIIWRLSPAISATSMCFVLRRWTTWWPSAFIGGLIYAFSSYSFWYDGYIFLAFVPLPPIALLLLYEIVVRQRWRPGIVGAALALVCVVQFFIWTEILASTVLMGGIAVVFYVLANPRATIRRWRYAAIAFASTLGFGCLLLAYPVLFTFTGPQRVNGPPASPSALSFAAPDLLAAVIPNHRYINPRLLTVAGPGLVFGFPSISAFHLSSRSFVSLSPFGNEERCSSLVLWHWSRSCCR